MVLYLPKLESKRSETFEKASDVRAKIGGLIVDFECHEQLACLYLFKKWQLKSLNQELAGVNDTRSQVSKPMRSFRPRFPPTGLH